MESRMGAGARGGGAELPPGRLVFEQVALALLADGMVDAGDAERLRFSAGTLREDGNIHPLVLLANMKLKAGVAPAGDLGLERLTEWLAGRVGMRYLHVDPTRWMAEQAGFFTRQEAEACGYADRDIRATVRAGVWVRFRRGFYTYADLWGALDEVGRHRVRSHAVMRSLGRRVALSHVSGTIDHDIDTWGMDLSRVHVTRLDGASGRTERDVVHHEGVCLEGDVLEYKSDKYQHNRDIQPSLLYREFEPQPDRQMKLDFHKADTTELRTVKKP